MKLKELVLNVKGWESLGLYDSDDTAINVEATAINVLENEDKEVRHSDLFIYDTDITDINGNKVPVKRIRMCVYLVA